MTSSLLRRTPFSNGHGNRLDIMIPCAMAVDTTPPTCYFELEMGLEPTTYGLQDRCATDCATPAHWALTRAKHEYPARFR